MYPSARALATKSDGSTARAAVRDQRSAPAKAFVGKTVTVRGSGATRARATSVRYDARAMAQQPSRVATRVDPRFALAAERLAAGLSVLRGLADAAVEIEPAGKRGCTVRVRAGDAEVVLDARPAGEQSTFYRRGERYDISYRAHDNVNFGIVDAVCDHFTKIEDILLDALQEHALRPQQRVGADSGQAPIEIDLRSISGLSDRLRHLPGVRAQLRHERKGNFDLQIDLPDAPASNPALRLRPVASTHNPLLAGNSLEITMSDAAAGSPHAPALYSFAKDLLAAEDALLERISPLDVQDTQLRFPVGRLSRFPIGSDIGMIFLTSPCFANCIFCGERTTERYAFSQLGSIVDSVTARTFSPRLVCIAGFEPLSHPGVAQLIAECRRSGIEEVELMTTGIPLADRQLVDSLVEAGLTSVAVPLYSHDEDTNDLIMRRAGAFRATMDGLDALCAAGVRIHLHALVLRQNLDHIDAIAALAKNRFAASFVAAPARNKESYPHTAFAYAELAKIRSARVLGAPFCFLPRMKDDPDVDRTRPLQHTLKPMAETMRAYFSQDLVQTDACSTCTYRHACTGIVGEQLTFEPKLRLTPFHER